MMYLYWCTLLRSHGPSFPPKTYHYILLCRNDNDGAFLCSVFACLWERTWIEITMCVSGYFSGSCFRAVTWMLTATPLEECCPFFGLWHTAAIANASHAKENTLQTADFDNGRESDSVCMHSINTNSNQAASNAWMCLLMTYSQNICVNEGLSALIVFTDNNTLQCCLAVELSMYACLLFIQCNTNNKRNER